MSEEEIRLIKGYFNEQYCCDLDEIKDIANKMIRENWRLNNIIKEVKEYIEKAKFEFESSCIDYGVIYDILQILNKGESDD